MDDSRGFGYSFNRLALIIKGGILIQGAAVVFLIWFFIQLLVGESTEYGFEALLAYVLFFLGVVVAAGLFLLTFVAFFVFVRKLGAYRKGFQWLAIYGCIVCLLPSGIINVRALNNNPKAEAVVFSVFGLLILSIRPVYYELMRRELAERLSEEAANRFRALLLINLGFILCCVVAFTFFMFRSSCLGGKNTDAITLWTILCCIAAAFGAIVYFVRLVYEFKVTCDTDKQLY